MINVLKKIFLTIITLGYYNPNNYNAISDEILNDMGTNAVYEEMFKHQEKYTFLLECYIHNSKINLYIKTVLKIFFFVFTMWTWYIMISLFQNSFNISIKILNKDVIDIKRTQITIDLLATVVPPLITLVTSFIVIPKVIAKYLFNRTEEQSMITLIANLQKYDSEVFKNKRIEDTQELLVTENEGEIERLSNLNNEVNS